jgi:hypothetical protein
MLKPIILRLFIVLSIFFFVNLQTSCAQDFIKEYRQYLLSRIKKEGDENAQIYRQRLINSNVKILKSVLNKMSKKTKQFFFNADAIYILDSSNVAQEDGGILIPPYSKLVWNSQKSSCSYKTHIEVINEKPKVILDTIEINAGNQLSSLDNRLKKIIEEADTSNFTNYINTSSPDSRVGISFTRAIKLKDHWKFVFSLTYIY